MKLAGTQVGLDRPLFLLSGPDTLESEAMCVEVAGHLKEVTDRLGMPYVFKGSFDKANRTSIDSYRGPGMEEGLRILQAVKDQIGVPVITDVHEYTPIAEVAEVADVLQTPAFLCRQTDFIQRVAAAGRPVNIKKGQFLSPWEMSRVVEKARASGNQQLMVCERGFSFGYNNLVVDMLGFGIMKQMGYPVFFDVTHALQMPGGRSDSAGGRRAQVTDLAKAGMSQGLAGLFLEAHPDPDNAKCDGPCALRLDQLEPFLGQLKALDDLVKSFPQLDTA